MPKKPSTTKKIVTKIKEDNERGARQNLMEELFYDFNRSKKQIYLVNLQRGIFFGIGSVIGGALVIAISAVILTQLVDLPVGIGDFVKRILDAMNSGAA